MSDDRPWEDYVDPVAAPAKPLGPLASMIVGQPYKGDSDVGYAEDVAKGAAGGLGRGIAGTVGIGGTVGNLIRSGLSKAGVSDETLDQGAKVARTLGAAIPELKLLTSPDATQVQSAIEGYTGPFYQPKTLPGKYASTAAEFAPGALLPGGIVARVLNTLVPAFASETAGQLTEGTAVEPYARGAAALLSGPAAAKAITPFAAASPARQAAVNVLEREGIPVTAGQRTGSSPLRYMESNAADMPFAAGTAQELASRQASAYDRAVTARLYDRGQLTARGVPADVNLPDPRVAQAGPQSLSDEYTRLTQNDLVSNARLHNRMTAAQNEYERTVLPNRRTALIENTKNDIVDRLLAGQGRMPGDEYQAIRSQIKADARTATNPREVTALKEISNSMDEAFASGLPSGDAAALALNNRRYALMKQLEPVVAAAGENLSPMRVAQTARVGRQGQYAAQQGDLDELAKAASLVLKPLPQSGTGPRTAMQKIFNVPNVIAAGGGSLGTVLGGPLAGAAMAGLPFGVARAVVSRPGQAYLGNQLLPQNPRDILAQTLAQQAVAQPAGIQRNEQARIDYERQRRQARLQQGLPE